MPIFTTSDGALVRQTLRGQREAFRHLVERYGAVAHAVAYAKLRSVDEAEEVAQEAFVLAFEKLDTLREPGKFGPWLAAIARNRAGRVRERRMRQAALAEQNLHTEAAASPEVEQRETCALVHEAVDGLDDALRETVLLFYFAGKPAKEVAVLLETTPEAVRKRLQRAREQIGEQLLATFAPEEMRDTARAKRVMAALPAGLPWAETEAAVGSGAASILSSKGALVAVIVAVGVVGVFTMLPRENSVVTATGEERLPPNEAAVEMPTPPNDVFPDDDLSPIESEVAASIRFTPKAHGMYGIVVKESGEPVAGARLEGIARPSFSQRRYGDLLPRTVLARDRTVTNADGEYYLAFSEMEDQGEYTGEVYVESPGLFGFTRFLGGLTQGGPSRWEIVVHDSAALFGTVVDAAGNSIAGATVALQNFSPSAPTKATVMHDGPRVETDASGGFRFDPALRGTYDLAVWRAGYVLATVSGDSGAALAPIVMRRGIRVEGVLRGDDTGLPVGGGHVRVVGQEAEIPVAEDGRFLLDTVAAGPVQLLLRHDGYVLDDLSGSIEVNPTSNQSVELLATLGGRIEGTMRDKAAGEPLAGVLVWAQHAGAYSGWPETVRMLKAGSRTDTRGTYALGPLLPGSYRVRFGESDIVPHVSDTEFAETGYLEVGTGQVVSHDIAVARPYRIEGRVVDESGAPLPGANVEIIADDVAEAFPGYLEKGGWVISDDAGRFCAYLPGPSEGAYVAVHGPTHASLNVGPFAVNESTAQDITIGTLPAASVSGRVVDGLGNASGFGSFTLTGDHVGGVYHISANLRTNPPRFQRREGVATQSTGSFFKGGLFPDDYTLRYEDTEQRISLAPDEKKRGIIVSPHAEGARAITGMVEYGGAPIRNVSIHMDTESAFSTEDGMFGLVMKQAEAQDLMASFSSTHAGTEIYRWQHAPVESFETAAGGLHIVFGAGTGTLTGKVRFNGEPGARLKVVLEAPLPNGEPESIEAQCAADGTYSIPQLPAGRYTVECRGNRDSRQVYGAAEVDVEDRMSSTLDFDLSVGDAQVTVAGIGADERVSVIVVPGEFTVGEVTEEHIRALYEQSYATAVFNQNETQGIDGMRSGIYTVVGGEFDATAHTIADSLPFLRLRTVVMEVSEGLTTDVALDFSE